MFDLKIFGVDLLHILYNFFAYSFIGWIYESTLVSVRKKSFVNRGFVNGPVIPIYGVGATIIYIFFWQIRTQYLIIFFGGMILASMLEYFTSWIMEVLFHARWWDYSDKLFNIKGRVCLLAGTAWGFMSLLEIGVLQPRVVRVYEAIPRVTGIYVVSIALLLFIIDMWITIVQTLKMDRIFAELLHIKEEFTDYIERTRIYETKEELKKRLSGYRISEMADKIRQFMDENKEKLLERNHYLEDFDFKSLRQDIEVQAKDYLSRIQSMIGSGNPIQRRLLRAFPDIKVIARIRKGEQLSSDTREVAAAETAGSLEGVNNRWKDMSANDNIIGSTKSYLSGILRVSLVGILVLIQMVLIVMLGYWVSGSVYIYIFIEVASIFIIVGLVNDNRNSSYKISWICIILLLPVTGHIMYALWGKSGSTQKIEKKIMACIQHGNTFLHYNEENAKSYALKYPTKSRMSKYMESQNFPLFKNNSVSYYPMGEDTFEAIFKDIEEASQFIFINFFIVGEGVLWERMHTLLLKKKSQGVEIKFMYDDFGATLRTSPNFRRNLEAEGIETAVFNPIHKYTDKLYMNYRSHQKILVIDGNIGYTGGMNLADEYVNLIERFGKWKDNAVRVEGEAVWGLTVTFLQMWEISKSGEWMDYNPYRPTKVFPENDVYCHVISDGPANRPNNPIESIYKQIIHYAKKYVYITTPYLVIEDDMKQALIEAAKSGVDVRIITPNIPDKKNVKKLTNYNYGQLLEGGVKIYEYTPGFIHAKTIINEDCGIVGTINMDYRSFFLHYECGLWMCNRDIIDDIKEDLIATMGISHEFTYEEWKHRPWLLKLNQRFLNLFSTLM